MKQFSRYPKLYKSCCILLCAAFLLAIPAPWHQDAQAGSGTYSSNDVMVLAKMIHGEARGEPYIGKVAVGAVILNRVKDKKFPDSVYSVCFQPGAFDAVRDGQYYMEPNQSSINAAKAAINGWDPYLRRSLLLESCHCHQQMGSGPARSSPRSGSMYLECEP